MSRWRTLGLIGVHVVMIGHFIHWRVAGKTLSPLEPSEAMYTLNEGHLNAGFILFAVAILATVVFGRYFCGWGCHFIAYQDLCTWVLKKLHIKPRPFRSRLLVFAPLALALYMFVLPTVYRWVTGGEAPRLSNHLATSDFWKTFPGPVIGVLTVGLAGFSIVYFLGSKGFCTYACPYGGFFGLADQLSPGRIVVSDACEHCGHCTAVCSSNVRVHEEVAKFGMVVDPGCMKCMDCVSVCPNDALHFGFARPSLGAKSSAPMRPVAYSFTLAEEVMMLVVGVAALLVLRGLYGQIPLLMAMGLAAITAYWFVIGWQVVRHANVRLQNLQLKKGGRLTRAGTAFAGLTILLLAFMGHSGFVRHQAWTGNRLYRSLHIDDDVWLAGSRWWDDATPEQRATAERATARLERADAWGLMSTYSALQDLTWLYLAQGRDQDAALALARLIELLPNEAAPHRGLAHVYRKRGRALEAMEQFREALRLDPHLAAARSGLGAVLAEQGRAEEALAVYREGMALAPHDPQWPFAIHGLLMEHGRTAEAIGELNKFVSAKPLSAKGHSLLGISLVGVGRMEEGVAALRRALELNDADADAHYNLGYALIGQRRLDDAITHLGRAAELAPEMMRAHYNLAVALYMAGRPGDALPAIREAARLAPDDPDTHGFMAVVLETLGDAEGAAAAREVARTLGAG